MEVRAKVIKAPAILRRAVSNPTAAVKLLSFNPEVTDAAQNEPTQLLIHKMNSLAVTKEMEEDTHQINAL